MQAYIWGNAPGAVLQYTYPAHLLQETGYYGSKVSDFNLVFPTYLALSLTLSLTLTQVFFYRAFYEGGNIQLNTNEVQDYLWVRRDEFKEYFEPQLLELALEYLPPDRY